MGGGPPNPCDGHGHCRARPRQATGISDCGLRPTWMPFPSRRPTLSTTRPPTRASCTPADTTSTPPPAWGVAHPATDLGRLVRHRALHLPTRRRVHPWRGERHGRRRVLKNPSRRAFLGNMCSQTFLQGRDARRGVHGVGRRDSPRRQRARRPCALPHKCRDAVLAASNVVVAAQQLVARLCPPGQPSVLRSASWKPRSTNVLPNEVRLKGTSAPWTKAGATKPTRRWPR